VLLLDEIEKAHPDVFNILLQILEDGRLTDAQGRTVDFRNTIVIMTSNIGAKDIARNVSFGFGTSDETGTSYEEMKDRIMGELKKVFRPEFLNRIDEVIVFHKLTMDEIKEIIELMIGRVRAQVAEHELQLDLDEGAKELLADRGWDPAMGARPLRRAIQRYIEDPLADEVLRQGDIASGSTVLVERDPSGDDEERPLKMTLVKPRKQPAKKREPVGVGAKSSDEDGTPSDAGSGPEPEGEGEGVPPEPEPDPERSPEPGPEPE
jgi:ATP-dependent Clp protease ATP-binding subunit ClpC